MTYRDEMNLRDRRNELFANYDRGAIAESEVRVAFVALLLDADDDATALDLCDSLPDWFQASFCQWLSEIAERNFAFRWFRIGDSRTPDEIEADSKRYQEILMRLGPSIMSLHGKPQQ
jgi:hypothetical protein